MNDAPRKIELRFYTTPAEADAIKRAAKARDLTVSAWTRKTMVTGAIRTLTARATVEDAAA
jgi:hypothetical protein